MGILNKGKWAITGFMVAVLILTIGSVFVPGKVISAINWVAARGNLPMIEQTPTQPAKVGAVSEMTVVGVRPDQISHEPVVILKEKQGERYLPIWIGLAEANAIAAGLEGISMPRPLTHDLLYSVLKTSGAEVISITISDIQDRTFYARIVINIADRQLDIDSRPSDAIAIAVRAGTPIYAEEKVLARAGVKLDEGIGSSPQL
jgi:hypothetical protein